MNPIIEVVVSHVDYSAGTGDAKCIGWDFSLFVNGERVMTSVGQQADFPATMARATALADLIVGCPVRVREGTETEQGWVPT